MSFAGRDTQHAEQILRDLVDGLGIVTVRLIMQKLAEAQLGACHDRQGQLGVADVEPVRAGRGLDAAEGLTHQFERRRSGVGKSSWEPTNGTSN